MAIVFNVFALISPAEEMKVERALELLEGATQSITSFDLAIRVTKTSTLKWTIVTDEKTGEKQEVCRKLQANESPKTIQRYFRQVFQGGKGRIESLDRPMGKISGPVMVYDGETERVLDLRDNTGSIRSPNPEIVGQGEDYRSCFRSVAGRIGLLKFLRQRKDLTLKRDEMDQKLFVMETRPHPMTDIDWPTSGFRLTIDPQKGFYPIVFEKWKEQAGKYFLFRRTSVNGWKRLNDGVWAPTHATTYLFVPPPNPMWGELAMEIDLKVDEAHSSWNTAIPEERFRLPFPTGMKVYDHLRSTAYVTGKPDAGENLQDLATNARKVVRLPPERPIVTVAWYLPWLYGIAGGVFGLLVLKGVMLYLRKREMISKP
jgi:hypothetical protein